MTYVVSDIHGDIGLWKKLLAKIGFGGSDAMFVLGDVIDYGEDGLEILEEMSYAQNIWPVAGEHEIAARKLLGGFQKLLETGSAPDASYITDMQKWMKDGGAVTLESFRALDADMKEGILEYLEDMPLYEEVTVKGKKYFLVHSGISEFHPDDEFDAYEEEEFFGDSPVRSIPGYTVIFGHEPTSGEIVRSEGSVCIDCGSGKGGRLAALRLEDGKVFYVD